MNETPRHRELLRAMEAHSAAEGSQDVEKTLATCTDDIVYEHPLYPDDHPDRFVRGRAAVREYYRRSFTKTPYHDIVLSRSWVCGDDTLVVEAEGRAGGPDGPLVRAIAIATIRDGRVAKEISYAPPPAG
jgi:ketosteroid isomerase-like protein